MMPRNIRHCLVIGSSRGLGAAMVAELIMEDEMFVIGLARSAAKDISGIDNWLKTGRYEHISIDVTQPQCVEVIKSACSEKVGQAPIMVIWNAAIVKSDSSHDNRIIYPVLDSINRVAVQGFRMVLEGVEGHMLKYGGVFVGISAFSAISPPVQELRLAYPATKAYLDMALRCLRFAWKDRVKVVTVHLGHLQSLGDGQRLWFIPDYHKAAKKIVGALRDNSVPNEINYPFLYNIAYRWVFRYIPDDIYYRMINGLSLVVKSMARGKPVI